VRRIAGCKFASEVLAGSPEPSKIDGHARLQRVRSSSCVAARMPGRPRRQICVSV